MHFYNVKIIILESDLKLYNMTGSSIIIIIIKLIN